MHSFDSHPLLITGFQYLITAEQGRENLPALTAIPHEFSGGYGLRLPDTTHFEDCDSLLALHYNPPTQLTQGFY